MKITRKHTRKQMSSSELMLRRQKKEKQEFLSKCRVLGVKTRNYDEAMNIDICAYSPDESQIGEYKRNTSSSIGNVYVSENDYDMLMLEE